MKPSTYLPLTHLRGSSTGTADVQTLAIPANASAFLLTVETTNARVTLDGSDPSAGSAPSLVFPKDSVPQLVLCGPGTTVKWVSTAAAACVVQVVPLQ